MKTRSTNIRGVRQHALLLLLLGGCAAPEERAGDYLANAREYVAKSELKLASVELKNALQIDPALVEAHYLQAALYEAEHNWNAYRDSLRRVVDLDPRHFDAQLKLGTFTALTGNLDEANAAARAALDVRAEDPAANALMGAVLLAQNDVEGASRHATRALASAPLDPDAIALQTSIHIHLKHYDEAARIVATGVEANPDSPLLRMQQIRVEEARGNSTGVVTAFEGLVERNPKSLEYYQAFASYYARNEQREKAEAVLRNAIDTVEDPTAAKLALATFLADDDPRRAARQLEEFIASGGPGATQLKFGLAQLYARRGEIDSAEALYRTIMDSEDDGASRARNQLAHIQIMQRRLEEASNYIEETLARDPGNTDALILRASIQLGRHHADDAIATLRTALRDAPDSARALDLLGRAYLSQGALELAQSTFVKALEIDPHDRVAAQQLAGMLVRREEYAAADELLSRAFQIDPRDSGTAQMLVRTKLALQRWEEAKAVIARAAPGEDTALAATYIDGLALQAAGDYMGSIKVFEQLLESRASSAVAIKSIDRSFRLMDKPDEGRKYLERLIEQPKDVPQAYLSLAEHHMKAKDWKSAEAVLQAALKRHAKWIPAYRALAVVQVAQGQMDDAIATERRILEIAPDDAWAKLYIAGIVEKQDKTQEAARLYQEVLDLDPSADVAANNLAALLIAGGDPEELDRAYALARRFESSRVPEYADTIGWIHVLRGNYPKGIELLERASAAAPDSAEIQYHLGAAYAASRDATRAKDHLERSLALAENGQAHPSPTEAKELLLGL